MSEEDEELDKVYPHMATEVETKNRKDFENKNHKNCFVASQAIDWLMQNRHQPMTRDQALQFAERLRQKGYIKWVGRKTKKISVSGKHSTGVGGFEVVALALSYSCPGPLLSAAAVASALSVTGPPFEDDDSYYVFERKSKHRQSKQAKSK